MGVLLDINDAPAAVTAALRVLVVASPVSMAASPPDGAVTVTVTMTEPGATVTPMDSAITPSKVASRDLKATVSKNRTVPPHTRVVDTEIALVSPQMVKPPEFTEPLCGRGQQRRASMGEGA